MLTTSQSLNPPNTLLEWIALATTLLGFAFAGWRAYITLVNKINDFGSRVNDVEKEDAKLHERTEIHSRQIESMNVDRNGLRDRLSTVEGKVEAIKEEMKDDRLAVMATLHANDKAAAERDSSLREAIGRLEERMNIRVMVRETVRELRQHGQT